MRGTMVKMDDLREFVSRTETKVFDPRDPASGLGGAEVLDASVVQRAGQWWLYLAGQAHGYGPTDICSASLPPRAPLSATGWKLTRDATGELAPVAGRSVRAWDSNGGRHCPSYVKGWDPHKSAWVERIYSISGDCGSALSCGRVVYHRAYADVIG
jgi:hypothetical protein